MTEPSHGNGPDEPTEIAVRFEATVHAGPKVAEAADVADLDLDRVPDPDGGVRALLTAEDCIRLLQRGYEVRLVGALPVRPLDPALIADDESVTRWLEERMTGIEREGS
ncbi:MAG: hypothetical protein ABJA87_11850 [bacterium]